MGGAPGARAWNGAGQATAGATASAPRGAQRAGPGEPRAQVGTAVPSGRRPPPGPPREPVFLPVRVPPSRSHAPPAPHPTSPREGGAAGRPVGGRCGKRRPRLVSAPVALGPRTCLAGPFGRRQLRCPRGCHLVPASRTPTPPAAAPATANRACACAPPHLLPNGRAVRPGTSRSAPGPAQRPAGPSRRPAGVRLRPSVFPFSRESRPRRLLRLVCALGFGGNRPNPGFLCRAPR